MLTVTGISLCLRRKYVFFQSNVQLIDLLLKIISCHLFSLSSYRSKGYNLSAWCKGKEDSSVHPHSLWGHIDQVQLNCDEG